MLTNLGRAHLPNARGLLVTSIFSIGMFGCSEVNRLNGGSMSCSSVVGLHRAVRRHSLIICNKCMQHYIPKSTDRFIILGLTFSVLDCK